jgi:hypothetical protein
MSYEPGPSAEEIAAQDRIALSKQPAYATESHQDLTVMREERRKRVEAAFGRAERTYLEALEFVVDKAEKLPNFDSNSGAVTDLLRAFDQALIAARAAEHDAAEKGRH